MTKASPSSATSATSPTSPTYSYLLPLYNEETRIAHLEKEILLFFDAFLKGESVEILLIDNGSTDRTWEKIEQLAKRDYRFVALLLTRHFADSDALHAGFHYATGEAILCIDSTLPDPLYPTKQMIAEWKKGYAIVYALPADSPHASRLSSTLSEASSWFFSKLTSTEIPRSEKDFILINRRALNALLQLKEYQRYLYTLTNWLGFPSTQIRYERPLAPSSPLKKITNVALWNKTLDALFGASLLPLRLSFIAGLLLLFLCFFYLFCTLCFSLFLGIEWPQGWFSLFLFMGFFGSFNLLCLGILGEYVGRIYREVQNRPHYLISRRIQNGLDYLE
jgi:glycosyltransferase involved in cell wall biosynthesis